MRWTAKRRRQGAPEATLTARSMANTIYGRQCACASGKGLPINEAISVTTQNSATCVSFRLPIKSQNPPVRFS